MNTWSFFDANTGEFVDRVFSGPERLLEMNTPDGCIAYPGEFDRLSQRVNLASMLVEDYQPPAPDADHEWIHDDEHGNRVRRWVLKPEVAERRARKAAALNRIAELERRQERAIREHVLGIVPTEEERAAGAMTLQEIEDEIAAQRAIIHSAESQAT